MKFLARDFFFGVFKTINLQQLFNSLTVAKKALESFQKFLIKFNYNLKLIQPHLP